MTKSKKQKAEAQARALAVTKMPAAPVAAKKKRNRKRGPGRSTAAGIGGAFTGIPAAVRTRVVRKGMSDIIRHRILWTLGYIYVGDGTNGAQDAVLFRTSAGALLGDASAQPAVIPILGSDSVLGKAYLADITKHYSRKVIHRMWCHIDALVPSTGSAMLAAVGFARGPSNVGKTTPVVFATAGATANSLDNVTSMSGSTTIESFAHITCEITKFIAGGSSALQNEFNVSVMDNNGGTAFVAGTPVSSTLPGGLEGVVPACLAVAGNNTVAAYRGVNMFEIVIEQEVSFLDYVGGMGATQPLA